MGPGHATGGFLPWTGIARHPPNVGPARALFLSGLAVFALVPVSLAGMLLDPRTLDHGYAGAESVWLKSLKFQLAVSVHLVTVALCLAALSAARRADRPMVVLAATLIACSIFEIAYIGLRGALGLRAQFATDPIGLVFHDLMGIGAGLIVLTTAVIGLRILLGRAAGVPPHLHLAAGLGLIVSGIGGLATGFTIGAADGPAIGATGGAGLPLFGWSGIGGDLRVAHFFAVHAAQALPLAALALAALALGARGPLGGRAAIAAVALLWSALILFTFLQALAGEPFLAIPSPRF